jgi:pimeloyl-ACP methyl ester carboxylesterase
VIFASPIISKFTTNAARTAFPPTRGDALDTDGTLMTTSYYRMGNGDTRVIALHGWFGDHSAFAPIWPHLDLSRFSYAFVDYRGYGGARTFGGEYTMQAISGDLCSDRSLYRIVSRSRWASILCQRAVYRSRSRAGHPPVGQPLIPVIDRRSRPIWMPGQR